MNKPNRVNRRVYWTLIGLGLLAAAALFIYHLATGYTPNATAVTIPILNAPIYWYGICIMGGIALGAYVIASIAAERAEALFLATVPPHVRERPLATLNLPAPIQQQLTQHRIATVGDLLWQWALEPRSLGLKSDSATALYDALLATPDVAQAWLDDAPWRQWNPDHVWNGLIMVIVLAIIGARLYHVLTPSPSMAAVGIHSPLDYFRNPAQLFNLRNGGLGIYGGLAGGALGLFLYTLRHRLSMLNWSDLAAIGVALGQVFGRWGNFFNQELYGRPTDLPWAITIDPPHRLPAYAQFSHFHPAFLYESLWSLGTFIVLWLLATRYADKVQPGELTALYLIFYATGRTLLEMVRLDSRTVSLGSVDLNIAVATLVSIGVALTMALWMLIRRWRVGS